MVLKMAVLFDRPHYFVGRHEVTEVEVMPSLNLDLNLGFDGPVCYVVFHARYNKKLL